jgi:hypothetical protein
VSGVEWIASLSVMTNGLLAIAVMHYRQRYRDLIDTFVWKLEITAKEPK